MKLVGTSSSSVCRQVRARICLGACEPCVWCPRLTADGGSGDCKGGPDFACTRGRKGRMCRDPEDGWTVVGDSWWLECGKYGGVGSALGMFATIMM